MKQPTKRPENLEIRNPATGGLIRQVEATAEGDVAATVAVARRAQEIWAGRSIEHRLEILGRFHDLMLNRVDRVLDTIQDETGKSRRDALSELVTVAGVTRYYLPRAQRLLAARKRRGALPFLTQAHLSYRPYGVVGLIAPWNFPFLLTAGDAVPALLAGNAVVIKPSERTPLSAIEFRELLMEAGMDPGVVQVLVGEGPVGAELVRHVDYVSFTGGASTGRRVAALAAERLIPCSLELGGKNPMVVLEGANLNDAAAGLVIGAFYNSGQACIAVENVFVSARIHDAFVGAVADRIRRIRMGWSRDWDIDMGSLISTEHADSVMSRIDEAVRSGAKVLAGGRRRTDLGRAFVEPTMLGDVNSRMPIMCEETFGPVVSVVPFDRVEDAVQQANQSTYGLHASVWGPRKAARRIADQLETGTAVVNSTLLIYNTFDLPMGGMKESGLGRRHGTPGLLRFVQAHGVAESYSRGGGYDAILSLLKGRRQMKRLLALMRWWRRIPGLR